VPDHTFLKAYPSPNTFIIMIIKYFDGFCPHPTHPAHAQKPAQAPRRRRKAARQPSFANAKNHQQGMTLIELSVVLLVLIALAGLTIPYIGGTGRTALCQTTDASLQAVKQAIMGGAAGVGFYDDMLGELPRDKANASGYNLGYLFSQGGWQTYNPTTAVGWRGPYLQSGGAATPPSLNASFINVFDPTTNTTGTVHLAIDASAGPQVMDAWHRPLILQAPYYGASYHPDQARLVSAGPDAVINTPINESDAASRGDDRVLFLIIPDPKQGGNTPCDQS